MPFTTVLAYKDALERIRTGQEKEDELNKWRFKAKQWVEEEKQKQLKGA